MSDDATVILVTWTITDQAVTTLTLEIQEGGVVRSRREGEGQWKPVKGAERLDRSTTEFKVTDLNADKKYRFRMDMRRPGEKNPFYVLSEKGTSYQSIFSDYVSLVIMQLPSTYTVHQQANYTRDQILTLFHLI